MNTYFFRYETTVSAIKELLSVKFEARNLSSALKLFWNESESYACPVKRLSTLYEVVNSEGKSSFRFLKDSVKVYPNED